MSSPRELIQSISDGQHASIGKRKRDRSDIVKLGGPADVRAIFTRARHFDFGPPFAGDPQVASGSDRF